MMSESVGTPRCPNDSSHTLEERPNGSFWCIDEEKVFGRDEVGASERPGPVVAEGTLCPSCGRPSLQPLSSGSFRCTVEDKIFGANELNSPYAKGPGATEPRTRELAGPSPWISASMAPGQHLARAMAGFAGPGGRVRNMIEKEAGQEPILAVVPGRGSQAVALTPRRVISVQGALVLRAVESVRLADIVNITSGPGVLHIGLTNGSTYELPLWPTQIETAKEFVRKVRLAQDSLAAAAQTPVASQVSPATPAPRIGIADELAKLAQLRDGGVLTEEEFQTQKAKLLSQS